MRQICKPFRNVVVKVFNPPPPPSGKSSLKPELMPSLFVFPLCQVNIPNETAESIVVLVQNDIIERGLFHDAAMSVFIPLMFFWKK